MAKGKIKILITGANGQLGSEMVKVFAADKKYEVTASDQQDFDITDKAQVRKFISIRKPEIIIHCAAWTDVERAAADPKAANKVNGWGTRNICSAAKEVKAKVIYISTNEVFDGKKGRPYAESDEPNPINPYGKSKLQGEAYCQKILGNSCTIIRTSWLYGPASINNFPNKILQRAAEQGFLKVVDDEISSPTYTIDLAAAIKQLVEKETWGVFHLVNEGQASRHDWAKEILNSKNLETSIRAIKLKDFNRASWPPKHAVVKNTRARGLGVILRNWKEANSEYLQKN